MMEELETTKINKPHSPCLTQRNQVPKPAPWSDGADFTEALTIPSQMPLICASDQSQEAAR